MYPTYQGWINSILSPIKEEEPSQDGKYTAWESDHQWYYGDKDGIRFELSYIDSFDLNNFKATLRVDVMLGSGLDGLKSPFNERIAEIEAMEFFAPYPAVKDGRVNKFHHEMIEELLKCQESVLLKYYRECVENSELSVMERDRAVLMVQLLLSRSGQS